MDGQAIVAAARGWIGTPFTHQASLKSRGADCIGLVAGVAAELGIPDASVWAADPVRRSYAPQPDAAVLIERARTYMDAIEIAELRVGDVIVMRYRRDPQHFAIVSCLDPFRVVHSYADVGRVVENILDAGWRRRIVAAFRLRLP